MADETEKPFHQGRANLIPAQAGEIRNPAGKPKGTRNRSTIVREIIEAVMAGEDVPQIDKATVAVLQKAIGGDVTAWEKLMDSAYGKVTDSLNIGGQKDNGLKVEVALVKTNKDSGDI